jgi:hypothetical protein
MTREMIDFLVSLKEPDHDVADELKALPATISVAQIDRLPVPARKALELRGASATRAAGASLRSQAPAQTHFDRKTARPGDFASDTVAHCGASC